MRRALLMTLQLDANGREKETERLYGERQCEDYNNSTRYSNINSIFVVRHANGWRCQPTALWHFYTPQRFAVVEPRLATMKNGIYIVTILPRVCATVAWFLSTEINMPWGPPAIFFWFVVSFLALRSTVLNPLVIFLLVPRAFFCAVLNALCFFVSLEYRTWQCIKCDKISRNADSPPESRIQCQNVRRSSSFLFFDYISSFHFNLPFCFLPPSVLRSDKEDAVEEESRAKKERRCRTNADKGTSSVM